MKWTGKKNRKVGWKNWIICIIIWIKSSTFNQVKIQGTCGIMHIWDNRLYHFTWPCFQTLWILFVMMNREKPGFPWYRIVKLLDVMHKLKSVMGQMLPLYKQLQFLIKKLMSLSSIHLLKAQWSGGLVNWVDTLTLL